MGVSAGLASGTPARTSACSPTPSGRACKPRSTGPRQQSETPRSPARSQGCSVAASAAAGLHPSSSVRAGRSTPISGCANGKKQHEKLTYVPESTIMDELAKVADVIRIDEVIAERVAKALNDSHADLRASRRRKATRFKDQLAELEGREDRLYDDLSGGVLDDVAYRRQLQRLRDQRARCTEQLEAANEELDRTYLADAQKILELAQQAKTLWLSQSDAERRKFLDAVLSNATLTGRSVQFELKKPFRILSGMAEGFDERARKDSNLRPSPPEGDALSS